VRTGTGIRLKEAMEAIAQLEQGAEPCSIVPGPLLPSDDNAQNEEIIEYEEFHVMAMASHAAGAANDDTDAEVEALFYSNVHAACTAPLRPLGAEGV
jgi:hypothetical protein